MKTKDIYLSEEILAMEDLYDLQDSFCSSGIPFRYQLTLDEMGWVNYTKGKYSIADWVLSNLDENEVLTFEDPQEMSKALYDNGMPPKAVMLSDSTALQKLFFWLYDESVEG